MRQFLILLAVAGFMQAQPAQRSYSGAGSCNSSNCHGGTTPLPESDSRILGNEYATWSVADKHQHAYKVLEEPRGKRMADILKIDATKDRRCTVCHVVGNRDQKTASDGVSCEACHGPAEQWLGPHAKSNPPPTQHADNVKLGMIDTRNIEVRAKLCLSCHLGSGERIVDHELIAAGHPDLAFELDTFTAAQPTHHRPRPAAMRLHAWAVGQATALGEGMRLLGEHGDKAWPEFSDLECYQCHHDLRADSWRIQRGYAGRKPGTLQVNLARYEVLDVLVATAAPDQRAALEGAWNGLAAQMSNKLSDGPGIARAAKAVEREADALSTRFLTQDIDAAAMARAISANIQRIADAGVNAAEQATMSLDALRAAQGKPPDAMAPLYDYLEHPSTYRPSEFIGIFRRVAGE